MQKNVSSQIWTVFAFQDEGGANPGEPVTGDAANITANVRIDGAAANAVDDTNPSEMEDGYYNFTITAAESNGEHIMIAPVSSTANVNVIGVPGALYTMPEQFPDSILATAAQVDAISSGSSGSFPFAPDADNIFKTTLDNAVAVNKGGGKVGFPITGHSFLAGREFVIAGAVEGTYNAAHTIDADTTANEVVVVITYVAESFSGSETAKSSFFGVVSVGTETGTFANVELNPATFHEMTHDSDAIDLIYRVPCGATRTAIDVDILAYLNSNNDVIQIRVRDQVGNSWDTLDTLVGQQGTGLVEKTLRLFAKHTGAFGGAFAGDAFIRFSCTSQSSPNLFVATLGCDAISADAATAYELGRIWYNSNAPTNTGVVPGIDGRAGNPVTTVAALNTLIVNTGIQDINVVNGSTLTFAGTVDNQSYFGDNWTLVLNGQSCAGVHVQGAILSGTYTGAAEFQGCHIQAVTSTDGTHFIGCGIEGNQTLGAGDIYFINCRHESATPPQFDFGAAVGNTTVHVHGYAGDIDLRNVGQSGTDVMEIDGFGGDIVLNVNCVGGNVFIHGPFGRTNNGTTTVHESERYSTEQINAEVLDVLSVDTFAEPTGVPPATDTLANKIGRVHMALRNKVTITATKKIFYDDAGNAEYEKDLSDAAGTYTETETNAP